MAAAPDRPPSERGIEFQTLDAIAELRRQVEDLAQRPAIVAASPNWWDVLRPVPSFLTGGVSSPAWLEIFAQYVTEVQIPHGSYSAYAPSFRVQVMTDRIELALRLNGAYTLWQRALFFDQAPAPR